MADDTPILILAAGTSSRMRGGDKLLELVDDQPQLRRLAAEALAVSAKVFIALRSDDQARKSVVADLDVTILELAEAAEGMGGTLRAAVARLSDCRRFMVVLGDLVAVTRHEMAQVLAAAETPALIWRGATADGSPGHPILFDALLRPDLANLSGDKGGESLISRIRDQTVLVRFKDDRARLDLDTPEDWAAYRADDPS